MQVIIVRTSPRPWLLPQARPLSLNHSLAPATAHSAGQSISPVPELLHVLAELAQAFPGRTISIIQGYTDPKRSSTAKSHSQGRALDLRIDHVDCMDIERFLVERP